MIQQPSTEAISSDLSQPATHTLPVCSLINYGLGLKITARRYCPLSKQFALGLHPADRDPANNGSGFMSVENQIKQVEQAGS